MTVTEAQYQEMLARCERNRSRGIAECEHEPVSDESELHQAIVDLCAGMGWKAFHGSMAHKTKRTVGEPDFIIALDNGKTVYFECKSKHGKPTPEQLGTIAHLHKLGHIAEIVTSIGQVCQIIQTVRQA